MKKRLSRNLATWISAAALSLLGGAAQSAQFGGVEFPGGASSFADVVTSFAPNVASNQPGVNFLNPANALGAPNFAGSLACSAASCPYVSLGDGGSITVEFVDNRLTGSGSNALDLWIFEIGPDVEDTAVEVSKDGMLFISVGKVAGATSGIDIDAFGFGIADQFRFVRLTDDTDKGDQTGVTVGADIDAIGAISSIAAPVPEPETWAMLMLGLAAVGAMKRRSRR